MASSINNASLSAVSSIENEKSTKTKTLIYALGV